MHDTSATKLDASNLRIGIAVSRYHGEITAALLKGATQSFRDVGGRDEAIETFDVPGTWELTGICRAIAMLESGEGRPTFDAIVALGCILTGETTHDQYIAQSVTQGLTAITIETGTPIAFGVLTCQTIEQARARAGLAARPGAHGGTANKGVEAMQAAIAAALAVRRIRERDRSVR